MRTHTCGELSLSNLGNSITLCGWVHRIRDKGKIFWIDLRDRYGITQLCFEESKNSNAIFKKIRSLNRESIIKVNGKVIKRKNRNINILTGEIEICVEHIELLNASLIPPFLIEEDSDGGEELRMKYRYLDLRRPNIQKNILLKHQIIQIIRTYLNEKQFIDIETPCLIKSTPEGARDFVVPSRINKGQYYALPQSPQIFKQILMIAGFDKYFQIVKCFRDEDLRADRQPEFLQLDCELSFVTQEDILNTFEVLIKTIFQKIVGVELNTFPRLTYQDAIHYYGTDKPDMRYDLKIYNATDIMKQIAFPPFQKAKYIGAISIPMKENYSRKKIDALKEWIKEKDDTAVFTFIKYYEKNNFTSSINKFLDTKDLLTCVDSMGIKEESIIFLLAGRKKCIKLLGELRLKVAKEEKLPYIKDFAGLWVTNFPLFEKDEQTNKLYSMHHPFTSPVSEDIEKLSSHPLSVRANAYDLVINGVEIGGGSIRIHDATLQSKIFSLLGLKENEIKEQFGFLLEALTYGAPPHGGIAFGIDRLCALLNHSITIRDFIAFPKNTAGRDTMMNTPQILSEKQLKELGIK